VREAAFILAWHEEESCLAAICKWHWRMTLAEHWLFRYPAAMRPLDIQVIGNELAIKWDDGGESFAALETLRRHCPCAGCKGELDIMGNLYKGPEIPLTPQSFQLVRFEIIGSYAWQPTWADGHATGLYSFDYLKRVTGAGQGSR
jgi:DUF971 family protein